GRTHIGKRPPSAPLEIGGRWVMYAPMASLCSSVMPPNAPIGPTGMGGQMVSPASFTPVLMSCDTRPGVQFLSPVVGSGVMFSEVTVPKGGTLNVSPPANALAMLIVPSLLRSVWHSMQTPTCVARYLPSNAWSYDGSVLEMMGSGMFATSTV